MSGVEPCHQVTTGASEASATVRRVLGERLDDLSDDDAYQALVALPGVGPWTAQVFLMFSLRRDDVLAAADIGVLNGIKLIFELDPRPTPRELAAMAEPWRPHRTAACRMAWHVASATPIAVPA